MGDGASEPVGDHLRALIRKDLIRPVGASEDTFRFRHQLIRDGAYEGIPKELRADLHERFADRLNAGSAAVPVADELLGYHLERAVLLRRELGAPRLPPRSSRRARRRSLRAAGRRAMARDDPGVGSAPRARASAGSAGGPRAGAGRARQCARRGRGSGALCRHGGRRRWSSRARTATGGPPRAPAS